MNKKVELLAPAGDMDCFLAAMLAGADAVYMAGKSFGARASASNFEKEDFISALNIAHIHGKKIYLTLNTLIKESEWTDIFDFLCPLYNAGLDGVIIQDLGLIDYLSKAFKNLELHASTQMTITDTSSANLLKNRGILRIVPARELSLKEITLIKNNTGLEIEAFIHGALCYSYSGQCLFSSFLGGRSGNRGRCAGPCRLPYTVCDNMDKVILKDSYPLSLKDLCTIDHIGELIEAGIDSFKIEGRLKSPEYVYGVTSIYRKYIDLYYEGKSTKVDKADRLLLESLYLRSSAKSGYYYAHNGKDMITLSDPSYNKMDKTIVDNISISLKNAKLKRPIDAYVYIHEGENIILSLYDEKYSISIEGDIVKKATNNPISLEEVKKRINKTGASSFCIRNIDIDIDDSSFVQVKELNELRRRAILEIENAILKDYYRNDSYKVLSDNGRAQDTKANNKVTLSIKVNDLSQLNSSLNYDFEKIYIPYDLFYSNKTNINEIVKKTNNKKLYLSLPRIIRNEDKYLKDLLSFTIQNKEHISGILASNLEELAFINDNKDNFSDIKIEADSSIYTWNKNSLAFISDYVDLTTAPLELSIKDIDMLNNKDIALIIYGHAPLMVSANCIAKTSNKCNKNINGNEFTLRDRYKKKEAVFMNCIHCYNEIYNSVATSYHNKLNQLIYKGYHNFRIDLTIENEDTCRQILDYYFKKNQDEFPVKEYTLGHFEKGAI